MTTPLTPKQSNRSTRRNNPMPKKPPKSKLPYVVVRTYSAGVHVGRLVKREGREVTLADARRIWRWQGANTLHEISLRGVAAGSKVSDPVAEITLTEAIEVITCAPAGEAALRSATWTA